MEHETLRFLLVVAAKVALVIAGATLLTRALRRRSASLRHLVWTAALATALVLPLGALALPEWRLPLLPARALAESPPEAPMTTPATAGPVVSPQGLSASESVTSVASSRLLLFTWIAGVTTTILRLIVGAAGLWWLGHRAGAKPCLEWRDLLDELCEHLRVAQPVRLLSSAGTSMPLSWGWIRPTLLLPASANAWTTDRARAVLLHELAHVKRRDCVTQFVAQLACAVYWFNPLVWIAAARLRAERERACDDVVLASGTRSSEYATHLLDIARGLHTARLWSWSALAMARPSQLEGRLLAILDPSRPRHGLTQRGSAVVAGCALVMAAALAAVEPSVRADDTPAPLYTQTANPPPPAQPTSSSPTKRRLVDALLPAVQDIDRSVRQQAATALGEVDDPSAVDPLVRMLRDMDPGVRSHAAAALGEIRDWRSTDALMAALGDAVVAVRVQAARALGELRDPKSIAALTARLKDADADVRWRATAALAEIRDYESGRKRR